MEDDSIFKTFSPLINEDEYGAILDPLISNEYDNF